MEKLLDHAAALGERPGYDALRSLGAELKTFAATLDYAAAASAMTPDNPRVFLGQHDAGPIVALRKYAPGYVSSVHGHAWTILLALEGGGTLERWQLDGDVATLVSAEATSREPVAIARYEAHRQRTTSGALELVVIADYSESTPQVEHEPDKHSAAFADLFDGFLAAWSAADIDALAPFYAENAFVDLHVPKWRVQIEGKEKALAFINAEEFQADYSVPRWSVSPTPDGWVMELQAHYTYNGGRSLSEMVHRVRLDDERRITRQHVYCTGIWDPATIAGLQHSGGLLQP